MKNERQRNRIERKINESHFGLHRVSHVATRLALGFEYECATVGVSIIGPSYSNHIVLNNGVEAQILSC